MPDTSEDRHAKYRALHREERRRESARWWKENGETYRAENRERLRAAQTRWREKNRDVARARVSAYQKDHPEKQRESEQKYRATHPDRRRQSCVAWRSNPENKEKEKQYRMAWASENKNRLAAKAAKRRALKLQATPAWADHDKILAYYLEAQRLTRETGIEHHVDHIVPLKSRLVCGLHVHMNLQILAGPENLSKGNRTWPDMWEAPQ